MMMAAVGAVVVLAVQLPSPPAATTGARAQRRGDARRGHALLTAFRDSLPAFSGNALRCTSCHLEAGGRAGALPWLGVAPTYPRYRARRGGMESMPQRVNECVTRSLAGRAIAEDGRDMADILAYLRVLGSIPRASATDSVLVAGLAAPGAAVFARECSRCHGEQGEGKSAPPVSGAGSFSVGAGMARQIVFASFVRRNMPLDRPGTLTAQQAADVAAYVLSQPRQDHPGKERDWPRGDAPADVAYPTVAARAAGKRLPSERPVLARRLK